MKKYILSLCTALVVATSALADSTNVLGQTWSYAVVDGKATIEGVAPGSGDVEIPRAFGKILVTRIGDGAFQACKGLVSVTIPDSVTAIGRQVFAGCDALTNFVVSAKNSKFSVKSGMLCTKNGQTLVQGVNGDVTIPVGVRSIGESAFYGLGGLTSVALPSEVTSVGALAFGFCSGLKSIVVETINSKFRSLDGMLCTKDGRTLVQGVNGDVTVPAGVRSIGESAFYGLGGLTSVALPSSVTSVGDHAFDYCSGLGSITVDDSNSKFKALEGMLCTKDGKKVIRGVGGEVTIPDGVAEIGEGAFCGCDGLTSVSIPPSVTNLGARAFEACGKLPVLAPQGEGLVRIGDEAFSGCGALKSVSIPASVKHIGAGAFEGCGGIYAFIVADDNSNYSSRNAMLCSKDGIRLIRGVNGNVLIPASVTRIEASAFAGCQELVSVSVPTNVTSVGKGAFDDTSLYARQPEGLFVVDCIACGVKGDCPQLVSVPTNVTVIGDSAFEGCAGLQTVRLRPRVAHIGADAFAACGDLKIVYVDDEGEINRVKGLYGWENDVTFKVVEVYRFLIGEKVRIDTGLKCRKIQNLPPGMCFSKSTGAVTGSGKSAGEFEVTFGGSRNPAELIDIIVREENVSLNTEAIVAAISRVGMNGSMKILAQADSTGVRSIAVCGLPKGMKFDKKTSSLVGAPTKSGEVTVKVTVTTGGGTKKVFEMKVNVAAPNPVTVGTFNGFAEPADVNGASACGTIVFTSSDVGKLTAKVTTPSNTVSLSKTGWDSREGEIYAVTLSNKTCTLNLALDADAAKDVHQLVGTFVTSEGAFAVSAQRKFFGTSCYLSATGDSTNGWTLAAAPVAASSNLTLTVKADGSTSLSGTLDGIKVKATGAVDMSGRSEGVLVAEFVQIVSVKSGKKTVKRPLYFRIELSIDSRESAGTVKGTALFAE